MAKTNVVTDFDSVSDIMKNGKGMMFDSLGGEFESDPSQVSIFTEEEKKKGLEFFSNIFTSVVDEVSGLSTYKPKKDVKQFVDQYNLTPNEVHFIKKVKPNKVFFLKKIPSVHFVKLSNGSFINAETYVFRLESGLINLNKKYEELQKLYESECRVNKEITETLKKHKSMTKKDLIKLIFKKLFRRNDA